LTVSFQNGEEFVILRDDGYVCATKLCKAGGRKLSNWMRLKETKEFIFKYDDELKKSVVQMSRAGK